MTLLLAGAGTGGGRPQAAPGFAMTALDPSGGPSWRPRAGVRLERPGGPRRASVRERRKPGALGPIPVLPAEEAWSVALAAAPSAPGDLDRERVYVPLVSGHVVALARRSGDLLWSVPVQTRVSPQAGQDVVFVAGEAEILALESATGRLRWRQMTDTATALALDETGGLLLAASGREIAALDQGSGAVRWRTPLDLSGPAFLVAQAGTACAAGQGGTLACLATADGHVRWTRRIPPLAGPPLVVPASRRVMAGAIDNYLYAIDLESGRLDWRRIAGGDVVGAAVDGDALVFASLDNTLWALRRGNGHQRWRHALSRRPAGPPIVVGGAVLQAAVARDLTLHDARTGDIIGTYTAPGDLEGPPLVDPDLKPFTVAIVVMTTDGRAIGLRPLSLLFREAPATPLPDLPGRLLPRERLAERQGRPLSAG